MMVFAGNAHPQLAQDVAEHLGLGLGKAVVGRFSDGEVMVEVQENVRGKDIFVMQPTCQPTNDNIMELLVVVDALRRSSALRVTAVIPYFGYSRQDRRPRSARVAISAKVVANMITSVGVDRVLTVDLHADQIQGFFDLPVDNIYATPIMIGDVRKQGYHDLVVVSPDVGGVVRARALAKRLNDAELAIIDKRRPRANEAQVMNIIGEVENRICVLVDDMVDTADRKRREGRVRSRRPRRAPARRLDRDHAPRGLRALHLPPARPLPRRPRRPRGALRDRRHRRRRRARRHGGREDGPA
jgi:ribose-phosphate pyrophosphokinase